MLNPMVKMAMPDWSPESAWESNIGQPAQNHMAFLIYKKISAGKCVHYERIKPLKLAGPEGLIAHHIRSLSDEQATSWILESAGLLRLSDNATEGFVVLFDATGGKAKSACFYELTHLGGSCRNARTNLALNFNVVIDSALDAPSPDFGLAFDVKRNALPKTILETLSLTGGPNGGDWKWDKSELQIGATVVQRH